MENNETAISTCNKVVHFPHGMIEGPDPTIQEAFRKSFYEGRELVFKQVMEQVLGRPPVILDITEFIIMLRQGSEWELIKYKDQIVGGMRFYFEGPTYCYDFDPQVKSF